MTMCFKNVCSIEYILKLKEKSFYSEYYFSFPTPYKRKGILLTKKTSKIRKGKKNKRGWKGRRINIGKTKSAYWSPERNL
jgi:hypothetical protein